LNIRWNKINRGLVLGAVLLIGLVGFIVFKHTQFQREIPTVREQVKAYVNGLLTLNLSPDGAEVGSALTDAQKVQKLSEMDGLIATYWTGESEKGYLDSDDVRANYEDTLKGISRARILNYTWEPLDKRITVTANGTDYATVQLNLENVTVESQGKLEELFVCNNLQYLYTEDMYMGEGIEIKPMEKEDGEGLGLDTGTYRSVFSGYMSLTLKRVDGEWRITGVQGALHLRAVSAIEEVAA